MYLTQGLRRAAQIRPQEQSTAFRERRRIWSETVDRIARIAGGLAQAGVQPGDRVAILALNSDRYFGCSVRSRREPNAGQIGRGALTVQACSR